MVSQSYERGASLVEYALLVALVSIVATGAVGYLGGEVEGEFQYTAAVIEGGNLLDRGSGGSGGGGGGSATVSFEDGNPEDFTRYTTGDTIGDWTVTAGSVNTLKSPSAEPDGANVLDLSGVDAGTIETTLDVIPSADYRVSFKVGENHRCTPDRADGTAASGQVLWNDQVIGTFSADVAHGEYESVSYVLPATGSSPARLALRSLVNSACGPTVDLVAVELIPR
ncbi:MAG: DUF642 domain-containing protein [Actinomycetota bacterium]